MEENRGGESHPNLVENLLWRRERLRMSCSIPSSIDDIEDFTSPPPQREASIPAGVSLHGVRRRGKGGGEEKEREEAKSTMIPGSHSVYVKTFGCAHNVSDSEYMQGLLAEYGYRLTEEKEEADAWVINSCTVKNPSESAFVHLLRKGVAQSKAVVVSGCVPQADKKMKALDGVSVIGVQQIDRVVEVVEEALKGNQVIVIGVLTCISY